MVIGLRWSLPMIMFKLKEPISVPLPAPKNQNLKYSTFPERQHVKML